MYIYIQKLYKQDGKYDDQQQFKDIIEAAMVSTPDGFTDNSPISPMKSTPVKKPTARKAQCLFTNIVYVKKTATCRVGASKSKRKSKETSTDGTKLGKNTTFSKWNDYMTVHAGQVFGDRNSTIEYLLQDNAAVVAPHTPLLVNQPHSAVGGSIQGEQALRLSHMYPLYRNDNKKIYGILE